MLTTRSLPFPVLTRSKNDFSTFEATLPQAEGPRTLNQSTARGTAFSQSATNSPFQPNRSGIMTVGGPLRVTSSHVWNN